jgi:hypothetical protein
MIAHQELAFRPFLCQPDMVGLTPGKTVPEYGNTGRAGGGGGPSIDIVATSAEQDRVVARRPRPDPSLSPTTGADL